jgi:structural maintenance of chromosome 2
MFIKQLVIDGFKSYANRTVIDGWDPAFNAITGLNGSGKSNILDAICFVLGITALSQVRVDNLQELVYKQGQSRVTKASVTVVFDNTDKERSPEGYKHCDEITVTRQIAIGNRGKYLIMASLPRPIPSATSSAPCSSTSTTRTSSSCRDASPRSST